MSDFDKLDDKEQLRVLVWFSGYNPDTGKKINKDGLTWKKIGKKNDWFKFIEYFKEEGVGKEETEKMINILEQRVGNAFDVGKKNKKEVKIIIPIEEKPEIKEEKPKDIKIKGDDITENLREINNIFGQIHNILRDKAGITGLNAMKETAQLLFLRIFDMLAEDNKVYVNIYNEKSDEFEKYLFDGPMRKKMGWYYSFKEILEADFSDKISCYQSVIKFLSDTITKDKEDEVYYRYERFNNNFSDLISMTHIENRQALQLLFEYVGKLNIVSLMENTDLIGLLYTHFIGWEKNTASELGQYFTNRDVINVIIDQINIKENPKVCDFCAGTGGFLTQAIRRMNKNNIIFRPTDIMGFELSTNVMPLARLNMMYSLKTVNKEDINFKNEDSFLMLNYDKTGKKDTSVKFWDEQKETFDIILMNPPFGASLGSKDKTISKSEKQNILDKSFQVGFRKWLESNFGKKYTKQKDVIFALYAYTFLKEGGYCGIVLPAGFVSNSNLKKYREFFINNTRIISIINIPSGLFENTGVESVVLVYQKVKTDEDYEVNFISLIDEPIGHKQGEHFDVVINPENTFKVSIGKIKENNFALNYKNYNRIEFIPTNISGEKFKKVKLGDIVLFDPQSKNTTSNKQNKGKYNFYISGASIHKCDVCDYNEPRILISSRFSANIFYDEHFSCSNNIHIIKTKNYDIKLIYSILKIFYSDILEKSMVGSVAKMLNKNFLVDFEILLTTREFTEDEINDIYLIANDDVVVVDALKTQRDYYLGIFKNEYKNAEKKEVKLGDIVKHRKKSTLPAEDGKEDGKYLFYTAGYEIKRTEKKLYEEKSIVIASSRHIYYRFDDLFSASSGNFIVYSDEYCLELLYVILSNYYNFSDVKYGTMYPTLKKNDFENYKINIISEPSEYIKELSIKISVIDKEINKLKFQSITEKERKKKILNELIYD